MMPVPQRLLTDRKKRVFIVDDHAVFRTGLRRLLSKEVDLDVCGEAANREELFDSVQSSKPDIVLMDLDLPRHNGIELTRQLRDRFPNLCVLIVTMHKECIYAGQALKAGAAGYVMKSESPDKLVKAIRQVLKGEVHVSPSVVSDLLKRLPMEADGKSPAQSLSARELQVFRLIGEGRGTRQIALELGLSVKTIESYRAHIKEKMGYETSYQLVRAAIVWSQEEKQL